MIFARRCINLELRSHLARDPRDRHRARPGCSSFRRPRTCRSRSTRRRRPRDQNQLIGFTADGTQLALIITPEGLATLAGLTDEIAVIGDLETEIGTVAGFAAQLTAFFGAGTTQIGGRIDIDTTEDTALSIRAANPGIQLVDSTNGANARMNAGDTGNLSFNADTNDEVAGSYHQWTIDGAPFMRLAAGGKLRVGAGGDAAVTAEFQGTDAMLLPVGTTAQRPTGAAGHIRFNSTTGNLEFYDGSGWQAVATV
jgi:hypothetical protein